MRFKFYKIISFETGQEIARFKTMEGACKYMLELERTNKKSPNNDFYMMIEIHHLTKMSLDRLYPPDTFSD